MNSIILALVGLILYLLAYKFYATFISRRILQLDPDRETASHELRDGTDYVPTNKYVLFGHHYASIAGVAPIIGPVVAVIWGWLPALLWVVFGTIFIGAVHDFTVLTLSTRNQGKSIGTLSEKFMGSSARIAFLLVIVFLLIILISVFALVIAKLFIQIPESATAAWTLMAMAIIVGLLIYRVKLNIKYATIIGILLLLFTIWLGSTYPWAPFGSGEAAVTTAHVNSWLVLLFAYAFIASVLPVWVLLQPRDYLNAFKLFAFLIVGYIGIFALGRTIIAPTLQLTATGAPPIWPFLMVTISCGAISGFHSLVGSGTTSKQLDNEKDAKFEGYGGMLGEGTLSLFAIIATTAGVSLALYSENYATWGSAGTSKLATFITGATTFSHGVLGPLGVSSEFCETWVTLVVVAFAMTTLDTATRLTRFALTEFAGNYGVKLNRYVATAIPVLVAAALTLTTYGGKATVMAMWPVFGVTNQLLAVLALLTVTIWLIKLKRPSLFTGIPMAFMLITTVVAAIYSIGWVYLPTGDYKLMIVTSIILMLALYICYKGFKAIKEVRTKPLRGNLEKVS
jgi:carbon starvation protein